MVTATPFRPPHSPFLSLDERGIWETINLPFLSMLGEVPVSCQIKSSEEAMGKAEVDLYITCQL